MEQRHFWQYFNFPTVENKTTTASGKEDGHIERTMEERRRRRENESVRRQRLGESNMVFRVFFFFFFVMGEIISEHEWFEFH